MHLIEVTPAPCLICGVGNTPNSNGERRRFIDLEVDTNWNDPAVLCEDCCIKIGGMIGMTSVDQLADLRQQLRQRRQEIHDLEVEIDSMKRRASKAGVAFAEMAN